MRLLPIQALEPASSVGFVMHTARLAGTLTTAPSLWGDDLRSLAANVELLEVRADRMGHLDPDWLRSHFRGTLLYTLRSTAEGGACDAAPEERHRRLRRAAHHYDLVDLEAERDLVPELLAQIPPGQRLVSWAGPATDAHSLRLRAQRLTSVDARLYRLVPEAAVNSDGLPPLEVLRAMNRRDLIAFAGGEAGFWSRLLALQVGAPFVFGSVSTETRSLSEPAIAQLVQDYGLPRSPRPDDLFGIVGNPLTHSLSPRLHNTAYRALGMPAFFVPFQEEHFSNFWRDMVEPNPLARLGISIAGLTVVSPHKEMPLEVGACGTAIVRRAHSANIVVRNNGGWRSDTTDPQGVAVALRERGIAIARQKAAVIGCGGAGRAVAAALDQLGADVTLVNRSLDRGLRAQRLLQLPFRPLAGFSPRNYSTVVNATPVGRDGESLPFDIAEMSKGSSIVDLTYGLEETPLIRRAHALGLTAVDGLEVCLIQVRHQFRIMTGLDMPTPASAERAESRAEVCSTGRP
jgi:3-dehydroquinate dehydratase / shikimate dehydrogenase